MTYTQEQVTNLGLAVQGYDEQLRAFETKYANGAAPSPADSVEIISLRARRDGANTTFEAAKSTYESEFRLQVAGGTPPNTTVTNALSTPGYTTDATSITFPVAFGSLRHYDNTPEGRERAYMDGLFILGTSFKPVDEDAGRGLREYCLDQLNTRYKGTTHNVRGDAYKGYAKRALGEAINATGGYLTPQVLEASVITIREQYGAFEANAQKVPLVTDDTRWPRRYQGIDANWEGEKISIPFDTSMEFNQISLNPKLLTSFIGISNQLTEDSIIPIADYVVGEMAYKFSYKIDSAAFLGTGTATYGGFLGLQTLFGATIPGTTTANPGLYTGTTAGEKSDWSKITIDEIVAWMGTLRMMGGNPADYKFYCSYAFMQQVLMRLKAKGGGNTVITLKDGAPGENLFQQEFLGHPIVPVQVLPSSATGDQTILAFFGNMGITSMLGVRKNLEVASSREAGSAFQTNQTYIRGIGRFAINNHDTGLTTVDPAGNHIASAMSAFRCSNS